MKNATIILLINLLVLTGCSGATAKSAETAKGEAVQSASQENVIWASGKLLPARWAGLSPAASGALRALHVAEGDQVAAGAVLAEVDNGILQSQVEVARAAVAEAEAARNKLLAGATPTELAQAQADVLAAQSGVAQAQANLKQAQEAGVVAEAQVAIAQAQYTELASRPSPAEKLEAQRRIDLARLALEQAQRSYDEVRGDPHIAALPQALALQQMTTDFEAAKAAYQVATQGATREQLAVAAAQINAAKAQVQVVRAQTPPAEAAVKSAEAQVVRGQAAFDRVKAGATAEDKAVAEARVKSAQATLAQAQAQLKQTQVSAPFAGQVGTIYVRPGELAAPGQPVLMFGDTSKLHVETTDLRETDVTKLKVNMPVEVTFDALPGRTFQGKITRIAPMSTTEKGSTNFTVIVEVPDLDGNLRWGMTAFVNIRVDK
jgi:multidrug efflux pump subunit AcrA (membrane-fusion protein)